MQGVDDTYNQPSNPPSSSVRVRCVLHEVESCKELSKHTKTSKVDDILANIQQKQLEIDDFNPVFTFCNAHPRSFITPAMADAAAVADAGSRNSRFSTLPTPARRLLSPWPTPVNPVPVIFFVPAKGVLPFPWIT